MGPSVDTSVDFIESIRRLEKENADLCDCTVRLGNSLALVKKNLFAVEKKRQEEKAEYDASNNVFQIRELDKGWRATFGILEAKLQSERDKSAALLVDLAKAEKQLHDLATNELIGVRIQVDLGPQANDLSPGIIRAIGDRLEKAFAN